MNNRSMGGQVVTLDPGAFPAIVAPYARYHFKSMGNASAEAPYVGGWDRRCARVAQGPGDCVGDAADWRS